MPNRIATSTSKFSAITNTRNATGNATSPGAPPFDLITPTILDLKTVDSSLQAFFGGFTDSTYLYLAPTWDRGNIARIALNDFTASGVDVLDLTTIDSDLTGFYGGFSDGTYGYLTPNHASKIVRFALNDFSSSGVTVLDLSSIDSLLKGHAGGFYHGGYGYLAPNYHGDTSVNSGYNGKLVRFSVSDFTTSGVTVLDLTTISAEYRGFSSIFTDGTYGYLSTYASGPGTIYYNLLRFALNDFTTSGVTAFSLSSVDSNARGFKASFTDGSYAYYVPYHIHGAQHGNFVRVSLADFSTTGVEILNLHSVDSTLGGFAGGFTDGTFAYIVGGYDGINAAGDSNYQSGKIVRIDLSDFTTSGVKVLDLEDSDSTLAGFQGGVTDGTFGYAVPTHASHSNGRLVRFPIEPFNWASTCAPPAATGCMSSA